MLNETALQNLKKSLPRGYFKKVCEKVSFSERTVARFFRGKAYFTDIHQAALDVAREYKEKKEALLREQSAVALNDKNQL